MRKSRRNSRKNRIKKDTGTITFIPVKTKSKAGIEYIKYKQVIQPAPIGFNHLTKRHILAKQKREKKNS